ncbi:MAG: glycosyltransferase family 4 protein [Lentisphaeraceae bacterium]|nr:glycosyltransferase family 4 protein [Lentisphaeraceae bacterium]
MKIVSLTPGTGSFHCGSCIRDNALVLAMRELGHDVLMVPLYLPFVHDGKDSSEGVPVFLGGVNAYLQQKSKVFRKLPKWMDRIFDHPSLLRKVSVNAGMTSANELGAITVSTLKGVEGFQKKEIDHLVSFLKGKEKPDVIMISNVLLTGLIPALKKEIGCKIVVTLQGEDTFLDSLPPEHSKEAWKLLHEHCEYVDLFTPVSHYYGDVMIKRLGLPKSNVKSVHNGLDLSEFKNSKLSLEPPVLGMLARLIPGKGVDILTDAFIHIRENDLVPKLKLKIAGSKLKSDEPFLKSIEEKLTHANLAGEVEFIYNLTAEEKVDYLASLSVFSTPAEYGESFGLYVVEAAASGLPVVQPDSAAFPEILEKLDTGLLYKTGDYKSLAEKITECVNQYEVYSEKARRARVTCKEVFSNKTMAEEILLNIEEA